MSERSSKELAQMLVVAQSQVTIGARYRHYKDRLYTVVTIALNEEMLEPCVVYQAEYGEKLIWIRPVSDWLKEVEWNGEIVPRFQLFSEKML